MKPGHFFELLSRFAEQPIPALHGRHVYLWLGEEDDLLSNGPKGLIKKLNLHLICKDISKTPLGDKAAGRVLSDAVEKWVMREISNRHHQTALLITGLDLFYRYRLPRSTFFQMATETTAIIFSVSAEDIAYRPAKPLPSDFEFLPLEILKYVSTGIPEEAIVKEE